MEGEIAVFEPIFARSASAVSLTEKVQLTLIGSSGTISVKFFMVASEWPRYQMT